MSGIDDYLYENHLELTELNLQPNSFENTNCEFENIHAVAATATSAAATSTIFSTNLLTNDLPMTCQTSSDHHHHHHHQSSPTQQIYDKNTSLNFEEIQKHPLDNYLPETTIQMSIVDNAIKYFITTSSSISDVQQQQPPPPPPPPIVSSGGFFQPLIETNKIVGTNNGQTKFIITNNSIQSNVQQSPTSGPSSQKTKIGNRFVKLLKRKITKPITTSELTTNQSNFHLSKPINSEQNKKPETIPECYRTTTNVTITADNNQLPTFLGQQNKPAILKKDSKSGIFSSINKQDSLNNMDPNHLVEDRTTNNINIISDEVIHPNINLLRIPIANNGIKDNQLTVLQSNNKSLPLSLGNQKNSLLDKDLRQLTATILKVPDDGNILLKEDRKTMVYHNPESGTKLVYRIIKPEDINLKKIVSNKIRTTSALITNSQSIGRVIATRGRPRKINEITTNKQLFDQQLFKEPSTILSASSLIQINRTPLTSTFSRTRSGRITKPPTYNTDYSFQHHHQHQYHPHNNGSSNRINTTENVDKPGKKLIENLTTNLKQQEFINIADSKLLTKVLMPNNASTNIKVTTTNVHGNSKPKRNRNLKNEHICGTCNKIYLGLKKIKRHLIMFPDHVMKTSKKSSSSDVPTETSTTDDNLLEYLIKKLKKTTINSKLSIFLKELSNFIENLELIGRQLLEDNINSPIEYIDKNVCKIFGISEGNYQLNDQILNEICAAADTADTADTLPLDKFLNDRRQSASNRQQFTIIKQHSIKHQESTSIGLLHQHHDGPQNQFQQPQLLQHHQQQRQEQHQSEELTDDLDHNLNVQDDSTIEIPDISFTDASSRESTSNNRLVYNLQFSLDSLSDSKLQLTDGISDESLFQTVEELVNERMKNIPNDTMSETNIPSLPPVVSYDHISDNAVEAGVIKTNNNLQPFLGMSLDLFPLDN